MTILAVLVSCSKLAEFFNVAFISVEEHCLVIFKLVDTRSVEMSFLQGLRDANVSLTHSGVDNVHN